MLGSITATEEQSQGRQTCYGHQKLVATRCGHNIHPSSSKKSPWCQKCISARIEGALDAARTLLLEEGGLAPADYVRNQHWNQARLKYHIAKQRAEDFRKADQRRWEREQAWDKVHKRWDSLYGQAGADCSACVSLMAPYATTMPEAQSANSVAWWDRPVNPAVPSVSKPRKSSTTPNKSRSHTARPESTAALHQMIQRFRASIHAWHAQQEALEIRYRTEMVFRRKHSIHGDFRFPPMFFNSPLPGLRITRRYQRAREDRRVAERHARGNVLRPKPLYSSLSYSESSDNLTVDKHWLEALMQKEQQEELDKKTRKLAREVGYLYFVGGNDMLREWGEDYMRSNTRLVFRRLVSDSDKKDKKDEDDSDDSDDSDESDDSDDSGVSDKGDEEM